MSEGTNNGLINLSIVVTFLMAGTFVYFVIQRGYENDLEQQQSEVIYLEQDSEVMRMEAQELLNANKQQEAIEQLTLALALNKDNDLAKQDLAKIYMAQCIASNENCHQARWLLDQLLNTYPDDAKLYKHRSDLLLHLGDTTGSNRDLKKAQELKLDMRILELDQAN